MAIGPAMANSLFSLSIEGGYLGGQLFYNILVVVMGAALASRSQISTLNSLDRFGRVDEHVDFIGMS